MKIEVWSDYSCPFCYIGKKKLEKAINKFDNKEKIEVIYKAYELNPDALNETSDKGYEAFAKVKNISIKDAKQMMDSVALTAKNYELEYNMDKILLINTKKAHRLAKWSNKYNMEAILTEKLMDSYFRLGLNIALDNVLLDIVKELDLNILEAKEVLLTNKYEVDVQKDIDEAINLGIRGVPFFVFNGKYAIRGAQDDKLFEKTLKEAYEEFKPFKELENETNDNNTCGSDGCNF